MLLLEMSSERKANTWHFYIHFGKYKFPKELFHIYFMGFFRLLFSTLLQLLYMWAFSVIQFSTFPNSVNLYFIQLFIVMESLFCCYSVKCKFIYSAECDLIITETTFPTIHLENQFNNQLIFKIMLTLNEIEKNNKTNCV